MVNNLLASAKKINKIHFLVHPGFLSNEVPKMEDKDPARNPYILRMDEYTLLFDKYIEEANKLGDNELMVAFAHTSLSQMAKDLQANKLYVEKLRELKKILGRRLIVLSGNNDVVHDDGVFDVVRDIAKQRGFYFDENTLTEAYGEMLSICVERGADRLNRNAGFKEKTLVRPELTDVPVYTPLDTLKEEMGEKHDRIRYE